MKISPRDIARFLSSPDQGGVCATLVYGPNEGQIRDTVKKLCAWAVPDTKDAFAVTEITPDNFSSDTSIADEMNAMNMLGGRRLVLIRYATDKMAPAIKDALSSYQGENYMVIEAGELTPRSALRKLSESEKNIASLACYEESSGEVAALLMQKLRENGFRPDHDIQQFFVQKFGNNRMQAEAEIEKIMCYAGFPKDSEQKPLTLSEVQDCAGDRVEQTLDSLLHAVMDGDFATADNQYQKLLQENTNVVQVLRSMQNYVARLQTVHGWRASGLSQSDAIHKLRPPVFFKNKPLLERHLSRWSLSALDDAMMRLIKTESAVKQTGTPVEQLTQRTLMALSHQALSGAQNRRRA